MAPLIRRAQASDIPRLGALHSAVWSELYSAVLPPSVLSTLTPSMMRGLWAKFIERGGAYEQYVAEIGGEVVGFAGVGPGREPGYELGRELYFIYVVPEYRRGTIGKTLLKQTDADYLWVAESNRPAQLFYRKQKYFPDSVRREGTLFGEPVPEMRMAR